MGMLFKNIIPMEMLVQMPLPFVHRLRDIRIKQLEEANKQNAGGAISPLAIENLVDELH